jgi:hypothetical protein
MYKKKRSMRERLFLLLVAGLELVGKTNTVKTILENNARDKRC